MTYGRFKEAILPHIEEMEQEIREGKKPIAKTKIVLAQTPLGFVLFKITLSQNGKLTIHQQPSLHGITSDNPREAVRQIIQGGFVGNTRGKLSSIAGNYDNTFHPPERKTMSNEAYKGAWEKGDDAFTLEFMAPEEKVDDFIVQMQNLFGNSAIRNRGQIYSMKPEDIRKSVSRGYLPKARPDQILRVNIHLNPKHPQEERERRMKAYMNEFKGVSVRFLDGTRMI